MHVSRVEKAFQLHVGLVPHLFSDCYISSKKRGKKFFCCLRHAGWYKGIEAYVLNKVFFSRVMLETQLILQTQFILQPNIYKLTWHPKWRVPHQRLKYTSALTFNTNEIIKILKLTKKKYRPPPIHRRHPPTTHVPAKIQWIDRISWRWNRNLLGNWEGTRRCRCYFCSK